MVVVVVVVGVVGAGVVGVVGATRFASLNPHFSRLLGGGVGGGPGGGVVVVGGGRVPAAAVAFALVGVVVVGVVVPATRDGAGKTDFGALQDPVRFKVLWGQHQEDPRINIMLPLWK